MNDTITNKYDADYITYLISHLNLTRETDIIYSNSHMIHSNDIDIEVKHTLNIDTLECSITATMNNTEWCLYKGHDLVMFEQLFDYPL